MTQTFGPRTNTNHSAPIRLISRTQVRGGLAKATCISGKLTRRHLIDTYFSDSAPYIALASFAIAAFALVFSIRGDRRKTGIEIRCDFGVASSVRSSERWVAEVRLENLKDRPISIYKIYLEVGHGLYIEVEDFTETPLTLGACSVYHRKYDPIEFYSAGMRRVTGFLDGKKTRQRILLTTSEGRYYPRRRTNTFNDPFLDTILKNYTTWVVFPLRWLHKGRSYGSEAKFVVTFANADAEDEVVPIYPHDHEIRKFHNFKLTQEAIESKQALEGFLQEQLTAGKLSCLDIDVIDLEAYRQEAFEDYPETIIVTPQGWFRHKIVGRCLTLWEKLLTSRKNKWLRSSGD